MEFGVSKNDAAPMTLSLPCTSSVTPDFLSSSISILDLISKLLPIDELTFTIPSRSAVPVES
jgi:hypothetical protein